MADLLGSDGERSSEAIRLAARAKIAGIDQRLRELGETRTRLEQLAAICERGDGTDCESLQVG